MSPITALFIILWAAAEWRNFKQKKYAKAAIAELRGDRNSLLTQNQDLLERNRLQLLTIKGLCEVPEKKKPGPKPGFKRQPKASTESAAQLELPLEQPTEA